MEQIEAMAKSIGMRVGQFLWAVCEQRGQDVGLGVDLRHNVMFFASDGELVALCSEYMRRHAKGEFD